MIKALIDEGYDVRSAAIKALGRLGDVRAVVPLREFSMNKELEIRDIAIDALKKLERVA